MFLEDISLNFIQPCTTDSKRIRIKAIPSVNIKSIFPYLNTYLKGAIYNKKACTLTLNYDSKIVIMYENEIAIAKILNETDAFETLDYIKDIINDCANKLDEIIPNDEMIKLPSPIDVYEYLPKINCGKCGVPTCLAFATKVIQGSYKPNRCIHLGDMGNKDEVESIYLILGYEI